MDRRAENGNHENFEDLLKQVRRDGKEHREGGQLAALPQLQPLIK
jgi:hypothetical protein